MNLAQPSTVPTSITYPINILNPLHPRQTPDGTATLQFSTKPELLERALKDITDNYNNTDPTAVTPTHLLLHNNIDIKASTSTQV